MSIIDIDPMDFEEVDKMSFKKIFCLLAVLILVFSANDAFAQISPRGVRVRIISPDSAAFAAITKTIKVNVLRTKGGLAPDLDTVI